MSRLSCALVRWGVLILLAASACKAPVVSSAVSDTDMPLESTTWKLTELDGRAVEVRSEQREPHFVLEPESHESGESGEETEERTGRLVGSGGCNRISGGYVRDAESIHIGPLISTRMACPEPIMSTESGFLLALETADRYEIDGDVLLLIEEDSVLARLGARASE